MPRIPDGTYNYPSFGSSCDARWNTSRLANAFDQMQGRNVDMSNMAYQQAGQFQDGTPRFNAYPAPKPSHVAQTAASRVQAVMTPDDVKDWEADKLRGRAYPLRSPSASIMAQLSPHFIRLDPINHRRLSWPNHRS